MPIVYVSFILMFYFNFSTLIYHSTIITDSYWIMFYLDDSFFNEDLASAVGSLSALLLKQLLSLLRNGKDPQPPDSDGEDQDDNNDAPEPGGGGGPPGQGDGDGDDDDEYFQKQFEEAKRRSLKDDEHDYDYIKNPHYRDPESSKKGGERELEEKENRQALRKSYNDAVRAFNENQEELVDRENLSPEHKEYLINKAEKLREVVDEFADLKRDLDTYSAEEDNSEEDNSEEDNSEYYSGENSDSDTRPSKRPRND